MSTILAPKIGENRLSEMTSPETTPEIKCWASRWYAEMVVELFLSKEAHARVDNFENLSLGDKIKEISIDFSGEIIDSLYFIEDHGNKSSHFKRDRAVCKKDSQKVVEKAIGLFDLVLLDLFKNKGLAKTPKLFSTFLPSIRVNVLHKLIDFTSLNNECEHDVALLQKYFLALTKNGQRDKARRLLSKLKSKEAITENQFCYW